MAKKQATARYIDPFSLDNDDKGKILGLIGTPKPAPPQFVNSPNLQMKKRNNTKLGGHSGH